MYPAESTRPRTASVSRIGLALATGLVSAVIGAGPAAAAPENPADALPFGVEASYLVFDRATGAVDAELDPHKQYRSASVVKLLIALDHLESHDPQTLPADDVARLQAMLRSSDDDTASYLWIQNGWQAIVERAITKLGLTDTAPPAARGMWGYTAISAADVVTIYRYILDGAAPAVRDFIMGNLHAATRCGQDGFDQSFGISRALGKPVAVKQGWSGFGDAPEPDRVCAPGSPRPPIPSGALTPAARSPFVLGPDGIREEWTPTQGAAPTPAAINLGKRAMHTTGTVGPADDKIVVCLTLEPTGTPWDVAAQRITLLTKAVDLAVWSASTGLGAR